MRWRTRRRVRVGKKREGSAAWCASRSVRTPNSTDIESGGPQKILYSYYCVCYTSMKYTVLYCCLSHAVNEHVVGWLVQRESEHGALVKEGFAEQPACLPRTCSRQTAKHLQFEQRARQNWELMLKLKIARFGKTCFEYAFSQLAKKNAQLAIWFRASDASASLEVRRFALVRHHRLARTTFSESPRVGTRAYFDQDKASRTTQPGPQQQPQRRSFRGRHHQLKRRAAH